jgi:flagellin-like hook-associated protein FlgL
MASNVTLTAAMRSNLVSLQNTQKLMDQTQTRLSTGKKVNTALDNPTNFFAAAAHTRRAADLTNRKDGMNEAVQGINASDNAITSLQSLFESAKGILETARTTDATGQAALYKAFNTVAAQISTLISDAGYKGTNFLNGTSVSLDVMFNETGSNKLTINGFDAKITGLLASANIGSAAVTNGYSNLAATGTFTAISTFKAGSAVAGILGSTVAAGFTNSYNLNAIASGLTAAISQLQTQSSRMAANLSIVNARLDFTSGIVNIEKTGADNLTLADNNEEGANMLMLQTRQSLGTTALSLASSAAQNILRLF